MTLESLQNGRYRRLRLLGSGGMGEVYLMEDTRIDRQVASKVIRTEASSYPTSDTARDAARLFLREAKSIAALEHPNILSLYDFGEEEQLQNMTLTYMVMPYCQDGSLAEWLQQRGGSTHLSLQNIALLIVQAADGLQYAHDHQVMHLDVKPPNFLIRRNHRDPNRPNLMLADFGVAKLNAKTSATSRTIRGTPSAMAPEQWSGTPVAASDQYALAVMAFELLTDRPPFLGGLEQLMYQHFHVQPPPPSSFNPRLPAAIDAVLLHALSKKPEERFPSISDFAGAFQQAVQDKSSEVSPELAPTFYKPLIPPTISALDAPNIANERDIRSTLRINKAEARSGVHRTLKLPGGRQVSVAVPADAYDGQIIRLEGQGEPGGNGDPAGALILTIAVIETETLPPLPPQPPPSSRPLRQILLLVGLVLLVIGGSIAGFFVIRGNQVPSDNTHATATVRANLTAQFTASVKAAASTVLASTQAQATADAIGINNPYGGTLLLNDPLRDNSNGQGWDENTASDGSFCKFKGGAYHAYQKDPQYFHACFAQNTNFSNFTYEVKMTILSGGCGGLVFRADSSSTQYYAFDVCQDGSFSLFYFDGSGWGSFIVGSDLDSAIKTGLNQSNLIAVVAYHAYLYLYVNKHLVRNTYNSRSDHGQIGVSNDPNGTTGPSEAVYSNMRLWTWWDSEQDKDDHKCRLVSDTKNNELPPNGRRPQHLSFVEYVVFFMYTSS